MRSLIDLVGRRRTAAEPPEPEPGPVRETGGPPRPEAAEPRVPEPEEADAQRPDEQRPDEQRPPRGGTQPPEPGRTEPDTATGPSDADRPARRDADGDADAADGGEAPARTAAARAGRSATRRRRIRTLPAVLGVVTVLLGGTAAWCADETKRVHDASGGGNVALTDVAATSDVKGVVTDAVNTIFSFDYADMARTRQAADHVLTGAAVGQYDAMVAQVQAQAPSQKLVLTTTVTDSAVEMLQDGRARLLLFADQRSTRTVAKDTTYAAAMLAVDAVRRGGNWKISAIDTLTGRR